MYSERQLIQRITAQVPSQIGARVLSGTGLRWGIGDDAAVVSPPRNADWVFSCDASIEGVHFGKSYPPDSIGYKSLARATSDLAAMGATPRLFLLTLAIPAARTGYWLGRFLGGMARAAREFRMWLAGGDTTKCPLVSVSVTVLGEAPKGCALTRSGARPGDLIYVTGRLGRAQLGWKLMRHQRGGKQSQSPLFQAHLYPRIRLELGAWLARERIPSAMMDLSDGLAIDLTRLCCASGVGAELDESLIPQVSPLPTLRFDPLEMALYGGEDYELLLTIPVHRKSRLEKAPGFRELTEIGRITPGKRIVRIAPDGRSKPLKPRGWDPFRKG